MRSFFPKIQAFLLMALLLMATLWRGAHHWVEHHRPIEHCHSDENKPHIHDDRYAPEECFSCDFTIAQFVKYSPIVRPAALTQAIEKREFFVKNSCFKTPQFRIFLRGPPADVA